MIFFKDPYRRLLCRRGRECRIQQLETVHLSLLGQQTTTEGENHVSLGLGLLSPLSLALCFAARSAAAELSSGRPSEPGSLLNNKIITHLSLSL
jgi:hypothetical protein